jgi:FkbM family methyltransferase
VQFRPYVITKTIQGETFSFCIGDETGENWYRPSKDPVYKELAFICDHMLSANDLVFDVGSHHGLHTVCMARHSARVVAIEPNPHNVAILKTNTELNALKNVIVRQVAVGDSIGKIALLRDSSEGGVLACKPGSVPTIEVDVLPLDQVAQEHGFPDLLKIDVEGFEDRALKGASQILQRCPKIVIEIHTDWLNRYGSSVNQIIALLNLEAYRVWVLPYATEKITACNGQDFNRYPPPKFTLFLIPTRLSP